MPEERERIGNEQLRGFHQGFLISIGRFVDREAAADIAFIAGQINETTASLLSEDIY